MVTITTRGVLVGFRLASLMYEIIHNSKIKLMHFGNYQAPSPNFGKQIAKEILLGFFLTKLNS